MTLYWKWMALSISIALGFFSCLTFTNATGPPPCWPPSTIDSDGDGRSNAVESENGSDPNTANPDNSISGGTPQNGCLKNGLRLPSQGTGSQQDGSTGYYHYLGTDANDTDNWGTLTLLNVAEFAGRCWDVKYPHSSGNPRMGAGDLSLQNGGPFGQHTSHENGLDVDARYVRKDNQESDVNINDAQYDRARSIELIQCFLNCERTTRVFTSDQAIVDHFTAKGETRVQNVSGHTNHFHVRIADPDGSQSCP